MNALPVSHTYQFQIAWDNGVDVVWQDIEPTSVLYRDGEPPTTHNYSGRIGDNRFISVSFDSTSEHPRLVESVFSIPNIPTTNPFQSEVASYRVRSKLVSTDSSGETAESEWGMPSPIRVIDTRPLIQNVVLSYGWNLVACVVEPVISSISELTKDNPFIPAHAALVWNPVTQKKEVTNTLELGKCYFFVATKPTTLRIE